jgi:NADH dehydrogenase (ubiquinone) 1 beta subcomplex subunit 7
MFLSSDPAQFSSEEVKFVPLALRDECLHLLFKLNHCRVETFYLPWKCVAKRHAYERCEWKLAQRRLKKNLQDKLNQLEAESQQNK